MRHLKSPGAAGAFFASRAGLSSPNSQCMVGLSFAPHRRRGRPLFARTHVPVDEPLVSGSSIPRPGWCPARARVPDATVTTTIPHLDAGSAQPPTISVMRMPACIRVGRRLPCKPCRNRVSGAYAMLQTANPTSQLGEKT